MSLPLLLELQENIVDAVNKNNLSDVNYFFFLSVYLLQRTHHLACFPTVCLPYSTEFSLLRHCLVELRSRFYSRLGYRPRLLSFIRAVVFVSYTATMIEAVAKKIGER